MSSDPAAQAGAAGGPTDEQLRAAYEDELSRIAPSEMMLQASVSLLNIAARKLGLTGGQRPPAGAPGGADGPSGPRELEQVRDAIDGVRALLEVLERCAPEQLRPVRDALSQLQLAYAREAGAAEGRGEAGGEPSQAPRREDAPAGRDAPAGEDGPRAPGPAEASGRLWVPGR